MANLLCVVRTLSWVPWGAIYLVSDIQWLELPKAIMNFHGPKGVQPLGFDRTST